MKTEQIALVLAIAREGSLSRAAESLFISQPTASNMLKAVESELGYPLFERTRLGMVPTAMGSEFIEHAGVIERSLEAIARIGRTGRRIDFRVISCGLDLAERAFERLCERCLDKDVALTLSYRTEDDVQAAASAVEIGKADVAVVLQREESRGSIVHDAAKRRLDVVSIGKCCLELTCNRDHPILAGGSIAYDLLGSHPCFKDVHASWVESLVPSPVAERCADARSVVITRPCEALYRLVRVAGGYLVGVPVSDETKAAYGFDSVPIEGAEVSVLAVYRKDPLKEGVIDEYIQACRSLA